MDQCKAHDQDVTNALAVLTTFQGYVQHADSKAGTLVVVHGGVTVAAMASQPILSVRSGVALLTVLAIFAVAFLVSGYHLIQALRPRMDTPEESSQLSLVAMADRAGLPVDLRGTEVYAMTRLFAEIAQAKYRHIARAVPWTAAMVASGVGGTVIGALTSS